MSKLSNEGRETTSGVLIGPASKFVKDNESERTVDASVEITHIANPEVGGAAVMAGGELVSSCHMETGKQMLSSQVQSVMPDCQIPHGVEFDPKTNKGKLIGT
ncbi:MAG: hypothetical protein ABFR90_10150 [Planctomycetota bacterium]